MKNPYLSRVSKRAPRLVTVCGAAALVASANIGAAQSFDPSRARLVDLTQPFNVSTVYWPTSPSGFTYAPIASGKTAGGWFYSAGAFQAPEHGGTHVDAPSHFDEGGVAVDKVALKSLVAPVVVIDATSGAASSPDYQIQLSDILQFETRYGPIKRGTIALVRTGWSSRWPEKRAYLGDDTPGETSNLHFPGFGEEAMRILVEGRGVAAVGLDTASLDPGNSTTFDAHRIAAAAGVAGFENLTNLDQIPASGAWLMALPMKIEGGSGAPLRAVAMVPEGK